jgi:hypothetical protein
MTLIPNAAQKNNLLQNKMFLSLYVKMLGFSQINLLKDLALSKNALMLAPQNLKL